MPRGEEEGIRVYLRIRPPPTAQQSRLLASNNNNGAGSSLSAAATASGGSKNPSSSPRTCQYEIEDDFHKSILHLHTTQRLLQDAQRSAGVGGPTGGANATESAVPDDVVNNTVVDFRYRFDRVFKPEATQEDVFNTVAKECVTSVLDGLNSTVFAYGQTGSGKTFSITGGTESYQDRGLIPRAMAMIYDEIARRRENTSENDATATTYTITMSYLQIYNDKGQDLLNHGHDARTLEELPPVFIHEMEDDIVLKGLEQHSAPTLSDALNLLFLGDTNRLYCETPMNKTSSRSHCIFTVYIEARSSTSSTVCRSKLNLVDLAGSERVSKTGVSGTILTEAKHINLSLHFLEQVIVALSEKAKGVRDHIPYRNSFLTMVLRDSLGRNCKTAMLATAHVVASQVAETISTCQFAQRVAMIQQAPQVNVETDPVLLVRKLKAEVAQLRDEVAYLRANGNGGDGGGSASTADRVLSDDEKGVCRSMVDAYVQRAAVDGDWNSRLTGLNGDMARMYFCYDVLRERLIREGLSTKGTGFKDDNTGNNTAAAAAAARAEEQRALLEESEGQVKALRQSLQLKENELQMLLTVLKRAGANGGGGVGAGRLGIAGARYNAPTQTLTNTNLSNSGTTPPSKNELNFQFTNETLSDEADSALRQRIYQEAQQLIRQLRQSCSGRNTSNGTSGVASEDGMRPSPAMSRFAAEAAAQAALTRVTALAQQGQLTEAEAAAATEFLERKKGFHEQRQQKSAQEAVNRDSCGATLTSDGNPANSRSAVDVLMDEQLLQDRAQALEAFKTTYEAQHKVEETKQLLKPKYESCKATAQQLNACVDTIKQLKTKIQRRRAERAAEGSDQVDSEEAAWLEELRTTKEAYNTHATQLRQDKEEIDGMHAYLKHAQEQLVRDFERWFSARQQQVQLAVQQQQRHAQQKGSEARQAGLASELRTVLGEATAAVGDTEVNNDSNSDDNVGSLAEASAPLNVQNGESVSQVTSVEPFHNGTTINSINNNSGGHEGYQALSATIHTSTVGRLYPSSAPVIPSSANPNSGSSSCAALRQPFTPGFVTSPVSSALPLTVNSSNPDAMSASLPNAAGVDSSCFPVSARAQNRLASLPTHMPSDPPVSSQLYLHQLQPQQQTQQTLFTSARTPEPLRCDESRVSPGLSTTTPFARASYPANPSAGLTGLGKINGWMNAAGDGQNNGGKTTDGGGANGTLATAASSAGGGGRVVGVISSPTRPFHLQPLGGSSNAGSDQQPYHLSTAFSATSPPPSVAGLTRAPATQPTAMVKGGLNGATVTSYVSSQLHQPQQQQQPSNPYFPQFPSTGNAAADEQLAQLYKAREAMRKQLQ